MPNTLIVIQHRTVGSKDACLSHVNNSFLIPFLFIAEYTISFSLSTAVIFKVCQYQIRISHISSAVKQQRVCDIRKGDFVTAPTTGAPSTGTTRSATAW